MNDKQLGVIGAGNMAEAILRGVVRGNVLSHGRIVAADPSLERRQKLLAELQIDAVPDNATAAACPRVLLAVKPQTMPAVLEEISPHVQGDALVISIAAGVKTGRIAERLGGAVRIVRVMPNTPMLVGAGVSAVAAGPRATEDDLLWVDRLLGACGRVVRVPMVPGWSTSQIIDAIRKLP